jgi:hypothetical protein
MDHDQMVDRQSLQPALDACVVRKARVSVRARCDAAMVINIFS